MSAEKKKQMGVLGLVIALVVVLFGGVLFVGAVSGWFDGTGVVLDAEYKCGETCDGELIDLTASGYEELVGSGASFGRRIMINWWRGGNRLWCLWIRTDARRRIG